MNKTNSKNKAIVIGLDGATFDLILPWIKQGHLPALKRLIENGVSAPLKSVIPITTPPAWTSLACGKAPDKHGVSNFFKHDHQNGNFVSRAYHAQDVKAQRIWDILSKNGYQSIVINYPVTYPPHIKNGIMVSGMFSPNLNNIIYPKLDGVTLPSKYRVELSSYLFKDKKDEFVKKLQEMISTRLDLTLKLKSQPWDLFIAVFIASDRAQHLLWEDDRLLSIYKELDNSITRLIENEKCNIVVVSDHGARGINGQACINNWLMENKYLVLKKPPKKSLSSFLPSREFLHKLSISHGALKIIRNTIPKKIRKKIPRKTLSLEENIDWDNTRAYSDGAGLVHINSKGCREQEGVLPSNYRKLRNEIIDKLLKLKDPENGEAIFDNVWRREEVYQGPLAYQMADIITYSKNYRPVPFFGNKIVIKNTKGLSIHDKHGIFIAHGPDIKSGEKYKEFSILDIAPTLLHLFGLPIDSSMDGRVLKEIFEEGSSPAIREVEFSQNKEVANQGAEQVYSTTDNKNIKNRLKGLGYF